MKSKVLTIIIHITAWIIFFSLPFIFLPNPLHGPSALKAQYFYFLKFLTSNIFLVFIFYLNANLLLPKFVFRKNYLAYAAIVLVFFTLFITYTDLFFQTPFSLHSPEEQTFFNPKRLNAIYLFIVIFFMSGGLRLMQEWRQTDRRNKMIESERLQTELLFLHSQINPHFLFNTLNSIYSLALMRSELTADAVMRLSSLMQYILQDVKSEKVPLDMEILCIQNYVELQKIRLNTNVEIQLVITGDFSSYQIPPLVLIPFIENTFKYGTSSHETTAITIEIEVDQNIFHLKTSNNIFEVREKSESFGIGFRNSERRLNLIYPKKHELSIINNSKMYILDLKIQLA